jgi:hypothetical protein
MKEDLEKIYQEVKSQSDYWLNSREQSEFWATFGYAVYMKYCYVKQEPRQILSECCGKKVVISKSTRKGTRLICSGCGENIKKPIK